MVVDNCTSWPVPASDPSHPPPHVLAGTFINNTAIGASHNTGGAIFTDRGSAIITNSVFEGNVANVSGGAVFAWSASGSCKNVTGSSSTGVLSAGSSGAPCVPGIPCVCQNVTITGCTFVRNVARGHHGGGALSNQWSDFLLKDNTCSDNVCYLCVVGLVLKNPTVFCTWSAPTSTPGASGYLDRPRQQHQHLRWHVPVTKPSRMVRVSCVFLFMLVL